MASQAPADSEELKTIDPADFLTQGFLQEANRLFFHPRGLALSVDVDEESGDATTLGPIWDYRDDPEGITFADGVMDPAKTAKVAAEQQKHLPTREKMFGEGGIQPAPTT